MMTVASATAAIVVVVDSFLHQPTFVYFNIVCTIFTSSPEFFCVCSKQPRRQQHKQQQQIANICKQSQLFKHLKLWTKKGFLSMTIHCHTNY